METKVVNFPKAKSAPRGPKTDADLVADVRRAWRKLQRAITSAERSGLKVQTNFGAGDEPKIWRNF